MRPLTATLAALAVIPLLAGGAALAQSRAPAQRQTLMDLAYVLGRSHALRQACEGRSDQYWRSRMARLITTEAPDPAFEAQLETAFNTGYAAAQSAFPRCGPAVRREQARAAARGRDLATSLTGPVAEDEPAR